jgi:hypothetical protein
MPEIIMGIDPGINATGVAWCHVLDGHIEAFTLRTKERGVLRKVDHIVERITNSAVPLWAVSDLIIELPQVYQRHKQKGDPNDLINLTVLVGAICNEMRNTENKTLVLPHEWKKQVSKTTHHKRIRKQIPYLGRQSKDALDAVGILLWGLERIEYANPYKR